MRVLIACEKFGLVREAFKARGHDAWSCDLEPSTGQHIVADVLTILDRGWDLLIAHPPCTYLCAAGIHRNACNPKRQLKTEEAVRFAARIFDCRINRVAVENPVGILSTRYRKPDQIIQPYMFGHDASKATCLWLRNLARLKPTMHIPPVMIGGLPRWGNQTDSGQNNLPESESRSDSRSKTYYGIAQAMANQWGHNG